MSEDNDIYESERDRLADLQDAEAATRRAESEANVLRNHALQSGDPSAMKAAMREALKEEIGAQKREQEIRSAETQRDLSGTAPTLSDSKGNFAPNPEVANVGGTGIDASNTKAGTTDQAQTAAEAGEATVSGAQKIVGDQPVGAAQISPAAETDETRTELAIPDNWQSLPWPQKRSLAAKLTSDPVANGDQADAAIQAELAKRG